MKSELVLELNSSSGNPRNSEGSFIRLKDGKIMFAYTRFYGDSYSDNATAEIAARYSEDDGLTWSYEDHILLKNECKVNIMSVSLLRLEDNRIAMFYLQKASNIQCLPVARFSENEGKSWTEPTPCTTASGYFVLNNDRVIQLQTGRIVVPVAYHRSKTADSVHSCAITTFFYSDDNGTTWQESKQWLLPPQHITTGFQEPGVIELNDGKLMCYMRTNAGSQWISYSSDQAETWSTPEPSPTFRSNCCAPMSIKRNPVNNTLIAVWNDNDPKWVSKNKITQDTKFHNSNYGRTPLVAAFSSDEGKNWTNHFLLENDPVRGFCYIAIYFTKIGILLAYCCGGGEKTIVLQDSCLRLLTDY